MRFECDADLDRFIALMRRANPLFVIWVIAYIFMMFPGFAMLHIIAPREQAPKLLWPLYNIGIWLLFCFLCFAGLLLVMKWLIPTVRDFTGVPCFTRDAVGNFVWAESAYAKWKKKGSKHQLRKSHTCISRIERFYPPLLGIPKVKALKEKIMMDMERNS